MNTHPLSSDLMWSPSNHSEDCRTRTSLVETSVCAEGMASGQEDSEGCDHGHDGRGEESSLKTDYLESLTYRYAKNASE